MKTLYLLAFLALAGCHNGQSIATIAPHAVVSHGASFDGNERNSGLIACDPAGCQVTQHFMDRHGLTSVSPGVVPDGKNWWLNAEAMARCIEQDRVRKNTQR